jgi:Holliday junction resolvasome RuvABC ATP-dependent DNA helicase subunit
VSGRARTRPARSCDCWPQRRTRSRRRRRSYAPRRLAEFVGQAQLKEHLSIMLEAARRREEPADHMLFAGPPGLGKTSLAGIVANEMGASFRVTSGPALVRAGDLAALLTNLSDGDVLFVDEIHRLARPVEEILYPAMEDFQLDIVSARDPRPEPAPGPAPLYPGRGDDPDRAYHRALARPVRLCRPARLLRSGRPRGDRA